MRSGETSGSKIFFEKHFFDSFFAHTNGDLRNRPANTRNHSIYRLLLKYSDHHSNNRHICVRFSNGDLNSGPMGSNIQMVIKLADHSVMGHMLLN